MATERPSNRYPDWTEADYLAAILEAIVEQGQRLDPATLDNRDPLDITTERYTDRDSKRAARLAKYAERLALLAGTVTPAE